MGCATRLWLDENAILPAATGPDEWYIVKTELSMNQSELITRDEEILGGIPVFAGTRVPVRTLWDYLEKGHSLDSFLEDFPTVTRSHAQDVLALARDKVAGQAA